MNITIESHHLRECVFLGIFYPKLGGFQRFVWDIIPESLGDGQIERASSAGVARAGGVKLFNNTPFWQSKVGRGSMFLTLGSWSMVHVFFLCISRWT